MYQKAGESSAQGASAPNKPSATIARFSKRSTQTFDRNSSLQPYITFTMEASKATQLVVKIWSKDQGTCNPENQRPSPYDNSHTFFAFGVVESSRSSHEQEFDEDDLIIFQKNVRAGRFVACHTNRWKISIDNREDEESEELEADADEFHDDADVVCGWVESLKDGNSIEIGIFPIAHFPGWVNYVLRMEVEVHYGGHDAAFYSNPSDFWSSNEDGDGKKIKGYARHIRMIKFADNSELGHAWASLARGQLTSLFNETGRSTNETTETVRTPKTELAKITAIAAESIPGPFKTQAQQHRLLVRTHELLVNSVEKGDNPIVLDHAISYMTCKLAESSKGDQDYNESLRDLAVAHIQRYRSKKIYSDLDTALAMSQEVLANIRSNPSDGNIKLSNLMHMTSLQLVLRYALRGNTNDLSEAMQLLEDAVPLTARDTMAYYRVVEQLADCLQFRFERTGLIDDINQAIELQRQVLRDSPDDRVLEAGFMTRLSGFLARRFTRTMDMKDIDESIQLGTQALKSYPKDAPKRSVCAKELVSHYAIRFLATQGDHLEKFGKLEQLDDLENGAQILRDLMKEMSLDDPVFEALYLDLMHISMTKFRQTKAPEDLETCIAIGRHGLQKTVGQDLNHMVHLGSLAEALSLKASCHPHPGHVADAESLREAIAHYKECLGSLNLLPIVHINFGQRYMKLCGVAESWDCVCEAGRTVISLCRGLMTRTLSRDDKQYILGHMFGIASMAAAAVLNQQNDPFEAVTFLEDGRGILASYLEGMHVDVQKLEQKHPYLAQRYVENRDLVHQITAVQEMHRPHNTAEFIVASHEKRAIRAESEQSLDAVLEEIRQQPGFENFGLRPTKLALTGLGTIVIINVSLLGGHAIIVRDDKIDALELPFLHMCMLKTYEEEFQLGSPIILEWLWDAVVSPVLEFLGFTESPAAGEGWPRVWWIPTGPLTRFSLHAAGYHLNGSSATVIDRVMSSYSPSITALIRSRDRAKPQQSRADKSAVLIAMENTPGALKPLQFAAEEAAVVESLCDTMDIKTFRPAADKQGVSNLLPNCDIFHFAGHGCTNPQDPSQSYLALQDYLDTPFSVEYLLGMSLWKNSPFLAYLSACGTGLVKDHKYFDESIHLISAFQLAGFQHVIGTLWEVEDFTCVAMAGLTYQTMNDHEMSDESVCLGLHTATRELRDEWVSQCATAGSTRATVVGDAIRNKQPEGGRLDHGKGKGVDTGECKHDRDVTLVAVKDENGDDNLPRAHWAPYVHFGI
ncbi:hypothetical protein VHEMI08880 [[Torrubiella] hemipterigena]|uniref:CHAT domain-containing protein n=1 Tax=[Torrubiella] hemipterigena TaxID=1531966 RepID=A0A0A1T862_9HYPO|nr:hypothetical protein VHEMI08880 [[Torrubiella] hemipterigena]